MERYLENLGNNLTLKERVYENIKTQIVLGNIKPGTRLLEKELSKVIGISRGPIREALSKLEKEGFVESNPRRGFSVTHITRKQIEDILEERNVLEQYATRKNFPHINQEKLTELENELKEKIVEFSGATENNNEIRETHFSLDNKFHYFFTRHCGNKKILSTLLNLQDHIHRLQSFVYVPGYFEKTGQEHLEIIKTARKNDMESVCKKLNWHSESLKDFLLSQIQE